MRRIITLLLLVTCFQAQAAYQSASIASKRTVDANGRSQHIGDSVKFVGIVQSPNHSRTARGLFFSIFDSSAAIMVFIDNTTPATKYNVIPGDQVEISGIIRDYINTYGTPVRRDSTGMIVVRPDSIKLISTGNTLKAAKAVNSFQENDEADLLQLDSMKLKNTAQWKVNTQQNANAGYAIVSVVRSGNAADSFHLRVSNTIITQMVAPNGIFHIRGILTQWHRRGPFLSEYQLLVGDSSDFDILTSTPLPVSKIANIKSTNKTTGREDSIGIYRKIRGIVQGPNFTKTGLHFSIFDNTGSIEIVNASNFGYTPAPGDSLEISGTVTQLMNGGMQTGWTAMVVADLKVLGYYYPTKPAIVVAKLSEKNESELVKVQKLKLRNPKQWDTTSLNPKNPKQSFYATVETTAGDTFYMLVLRQDSSLWYTAKPTGFFNLTGIEGQADAKAPFLQDYYLIPRDYHDLEPLVVLPPLVDISQIRGNDFSGVNLASQANAKVYLKGIVYSQNFMDNGDLVFSIEDRTGAMMIFSDQQTFGYTPALGDSVKVRGQVVQLRGMVYLAVDSVGRISSGNTQRKANTVSSLTESDEAYHRTLQGLKLKNPAQWDTTNAWIDSGFDVTVQDTLSGDTFSVWINRVTDLYGAPAPTGAFNLTGIVWQYDLTSPYTDGYYIMPRGAFDLELLSGSAISEKERVNDILGLYPNPAYEYIQIRLAAQYQALSVRLQIVNAQGQTVLEKAVPLQPNGGDARIEVKELPSGLYIIKILDPNGNFSGFSRFIRE